jgi:hypothetical protein
MHTLINSKCSKKYKFANLMDFNESFSEELKSTQGYKEAFVSYNEFVNKMVQTHKKYISDWKAIHSEWDTLYPEANPIGYIPDMHF